MKTRTPIKLSPAQEAFARAVAIVKRDPAYARRKEREYFHANRSALAAFNNYIEQARCAYADGARDEGDQWFEMARKADRERSDTFLQWDRYESAIKDAAAQAQL